MNISKYNFPHLGSLIYFTCAFLTLTFIKYQAPEMLIVFKPLYLGIGFISYYLLIRPSTMPLPAALCYGLIFLILVKTTTEINILSNPSLSNITFGIKRWF